jgi:hypothetical protein
MKKENQISIIEKFLISNEENLLINQVNDELGIFYLNVIKFFADKQGIKINFEENGDSVESVNDLFGQKEIKIIRNSSTKKLAIALNKNNKKIIFTDYKNYKKLNTKIKSVNGYKFEADIIIFIKDRLKINNDELLLYCKNNPIFLISEISKYIINNHQYSSDQALVDEKNHILEIRKSIFEIKNNNFNIKNLYFYIKKEANYKKLSFLTY